MARVDDIITKVRDTLAEYTPNRWSNQRLLRSLSECQNKIARQALCLRHDVTIQMCDGHHTYKLDDTAAPAGSPIAIAQIINHAGKPCTFVTEQRISEINADWRTETGNDITHIIYDRLKPKIFRVYPIPDATKLVQTGATFNVIDNPVTASATVVEQITTVSDFDITAELAPVKMQVNFYHTADPVVTLEDTNLLVSEHFDDAIKFYITGMTLKDDQDEANRAFAKSELELYMDEFNFAKGLSTKDFTKTPKTYYPAEYDKVI